MENNNKKRSFWKHYDILRKRWLTEDEIEADEQYCDYWKGVSTFVYYFILLPISLVCIAYCLSFVFAT